MNKNNLFNFINEKVISRRNDERFADFERLIENELDVDFSLVKKRIDTYSEFNKNLYIPFLNNKDKIFYRGERLEDRKRPLIPTIFRNREALFSSDSAIANVNSNFIYNYYKDYGDFLNLYEKIMKTNSKDDMYNLCAFSQHYLDISPFVDFTKSLFVSLSFALKGKNKVDDDIIIYTVEIKNEDDYTTDKNIANKWIDDYNVLVFRQNEDLIKEIVESDNKMLRLSMMKKELERYNAFKVSSAPKAKLIDIPTNDLMRFQQGVFLLLDDFKLTYTAYPTKNIRNSFEVTKWVINKELASKIQNLIKKEASWYSYDCLLDVKKAFEKASK